MSFVRKHVDVWDGVVLQGHPCRDTLVSYLFEGVSVHELLIASHRGGRWATRTMRVNSRELYLRIVSRQRTEASLTPKRHSSARGGVAKRKDVRRRAGPERPRLTQVLSVEETKSRVTYAARPLNQLCRRIRYTLR